ncbi:alpha/beta hydrolase [Nocardioides sp. KC13]|uniref:Alpha/beta hydrolase n=1 Tax=Nocardioides turkmenicus TaxID=2711220 RepID=A0A6M1QWE7_9ACTN|nr:alpha/beta hydrolase [Nocardioides sp. KC13]NGN94263.1 alpha/beta hydrolase [Nocardioides sp. KC13]
MVELRARRAALLANPRLTWVFGADDPGVVMREAWAGELRLRIHVPQARPAPVEGWPIVLAFHGGGWCWGSPEQSRWMAGRIAARTGAVVVAPAYRLAPEHPYPAAVEDCWTVLTWVTTHAADLGADAGRIAVLGDSAGGTLAAVMALRARDEGGPQVRGQVLIYPLVDLVGLRGPGFGGIVKHYLGGDGSRAEEWAASPLRAASHAGLPPALILTARFDPLRRHAERYAEVLRTAGVEVAVHSPTLATHAYLTLPGISPASRAGLTRVVTFLDQVLVSK